MNWIQQVLFWTALPLSLFLAVAAIRAFYAVAKGES
jgi:hypothetical protein